jgi:hypothetical protein
MPQQPKLPLIAMANESGFPSIYKFDGGHLYHSWIISLLPLMEEQDLYNKIKSDTAIETGKSDYDESFYELSKLADFNSYTIPILKCKSSGKQSTGSAISYVVNAGVQDYGYQFNSNGTIFLAADGSPVIEFKNAPERLSTKYSAFLIGYYYHNKIDNTKITDIKSTSKTLVLSESLKAYEWTFGLKILSAYDKANNKTMTTDSYHRCEEQLGFTYPTYINNLSSANPTFNDDTVSFINVKYGGYSYAPSSNHPGIVVASFADGGVRPLNETIATDVYIKLCQPAAGSDIDTGTDLGW